MINNSRVTELVGHSRQNVTSYELGRLHRQMRMIKTREDGTDMWQAWKNNRNADGVLVGTAQSVWQLAMGWTVRGSNPGGGSEIFRTRPDRPWSLTSLPHNGYRVFSGVKRPRRGAEVKERVKLYLYYPSRPSWPVLRWTLPLPLPLPLTERPLGRHRRARETKRHLGGCELHPSGSG